MVYFILNNLKKYAKTKTNLLKFNRPLFLNMMAMVSGPLGHNLKLTVELKTEIKSKKWSYAYIRVVLKLIQTYTRPRLPKVCHIREKKFYADLTVVFFKGDNRCLNFFKEAI